MADTEPLDRIRKPKAKISGWFKYARVYDAAIAAACDGAIFVEVGSWKGLSAYYMASKNAVVVVARVKHDEIARPVSEGQGGLKARHRHRLQEIPHWCDVAQECFIERPANDVRILLVLPPNPANDRRS